MSQELLCALLRTDFLAFVERCFREVVPGSLFQSNWHLEAMCHALREMGFKKRRRQIIEIPPRSLKSICASVALPAWILGHDPTRKIISVSYSQELASQHASMCRQIMKSAWYRELFPLTAISPQKDREDYYRTTAGGYRDATSVGGTLTGKGGDLIIIDDPMKPDDAYSEAQRESLKKWYNQTLLSRLNNKLTDGILLVMQRLHEDDLAGHVRKQGHWDILTIPAIAEKDELVRTGPSRDHLRKKGEVIDPARESREVLNELAGHMGSHAFAAQYQQDPSSAQSSIVAWGWFKKFSIPPERGAIVQSWDMAAKDTQFSDYSVCTTWSIYNGEYFLIDVFRERLEFPGLLRAVIKQWERWRSSEILIEDAAAGMYIVPQLRLERPSSMPSPIPIPAEKDKISRLHAASAVIEQGRVFLPLDAPWLEELQREIMAFPHGKHDDQVDSLSQLIIRQERKRQNPYVAERRSIFHSNAR